MKMKVFELKDYEYKDFINKAMEFIFLESTYEEQVITLLSAVGSLTRHIFKIYSKEGKKVALVIDGYAEAKIPLKNRFLSIQEDDAALIVY